MFPQACVPCRLGAWHTVHRDLEFHEGSPEPADAGPCTSDCDQPYDQSTVDGKWEIRFVTLDERSIKPPEEITGSITCAESTGGFRSYRLKPLSDYDQDGVCEVFIEINEAWEGSYPHPPSLAYTVRDGAIVEYKPLEGIHIHKADDEDRDGLLDPRSSHPYYEVVSSVSGEDRIEGPSLLFHAQRDGSFVRDDAVARAVALKECPDQSEDILSGDRKHYSYLYQVLRRIACARIHGIPASHLQKSLKVLCPGPPVSSCKELALNQCHFCRIAHHWLSLEPPVHLQPVGTRSRPGQGRG